MPPGCCGGNVKVELNLFIYAMKSNLKRATGVGKSMLRSKTGLASLKADNLRIFLMI